MSDRTFETCRDGFELVSEVVRLVNDLASARFTLADSESCRELLTNKVCRLEAELARKQAEWESLSAGGREQVRRLSETNGKLRAELATKELKETKQ